MPYQDIPGIRTRPRNPADAAHFAAATTQTKLKAQKQPTQPKRLASSDHSQSAKRQHIHESSPHIAFDPSNPPQPSTIEPAYEISPQHVKQDQPGERYPNYSTLH